MSTTAALNRSKNDDRFYYPPGRRNLQLQQQNQNQSQKLEREEVKVVKQQRNNRFHQKSNSSQVQRRQKSADAAMVVEAVAGVKGKLPENRMEVDDCASTSMTTAAAAAPSTTRTTMASPAAVSSSLTNLDRFLEYTTPLVPAQYFSKTSMKRWRKQDEDFRPYFVLGDLWESFKEWSAFGAGVPLLLNGSNSVVQYYVPYLSGIQLYADPSKPSPKNRVPGEESDESCRETSSDGSSDGEIESRLQGLKGLSLRDKPLNGSSSEEGEPSNSLGDLIFHHLEKDLPFLREPLADKISSLANQCPELKTARSCDLSPSSWVSVAWYPIYRIPVGPTLQNLDSCFLTYHHLYTPVSGRRNEWQCHFGSTSLETDAVKLPLPIFGMGCYKYKISTWDQNGVHVSPKANSLIQAADEWLQHLNVKEYMDYNHFSSNPFDYR